MAAGCSLFAEIKANQRNDKDGLCQDGFIGAILVAQRAGKWNRSGGNSLALSDTCFEEPETVYSTPSSL